MEMEAGRRPETAECVTGIVVNGQWHELSPATSGTLLTLLRAGLGLTGAKPGCGEGECGACTVLVDGMLHGAVLRPPVRGPGCTGAAPRSSSSATSGRWP